MRVDALTLAAIAGELQVSLRGVRVETVIAPTPQSIALECYGNGQKRWLLLSAHPQLGRVHTLTEKPRKLVTEPSSFVMLLRKHLEGARLDEARAVAWERIVRLTFGRGPSVEHVTLVAEIMGNLANILLLDSSQTILGVLRPMPPSLNPYRAFLPNKTYLPPPTQTRQTANGAVPRLLPAQATAAELAAANQEAATPVWRILTGQLAGFSPDLGREVSCQALGQSLAEIPVGEVAAWDPVVRAIHAVAERAATGQFQPVAQLNGASEIVEAALWPPCSPALSPASAADGKRSERDAGTGRWQPMNSVNELLAAYFAAREFRDALGSTAGDLRRALKSARERLERKLRALQGDLAQMDQAETLRAEGELLLTYGTDLPARATTFTAPDDGASMSARTITLDPQLTAVENANQRFARYQKLRRAALQIPPQVERATTDLARVAQIQTDLDLAETLADMAQVRAEIVEARLGQVDKEPESARKKVSTAGKGQAKGKATKPLGGDPLKFRSAEGFTIYVGKNSRQNEQVTFTLATGNDLWLHARGVPGAHVVVKSGGRTISPATIELAAGLAAWYSQSRQSGSVPVDYTEQRYVRHMKDGGPGMVIYTRERTLHATPHEP